MRLLVTVLLLVSLILVAFAQAKIVLTVKAVDNHGRLLAGVPIWVDGVVYRTNVNGTVQLVVNPGYHMLIAYPNLTTYSVVHGNVCDYVYVEMVIFREWTWSNRKTMYPDVLIFVNRNVTLFAHYAVYNMSIRTIPHIRFIQPRLRLWVLRNEWISTGAYAHGYDVVPRELGEHFYTRFIDAVSGEEIQIPTAVVYVDVGAGSKSSPINCTVLAYRYNRLIDKVWLCRNAHGSCKTEIVIHNTTFVLINASTYSTDLYFDVDIYVPKTFTRNIWLYRCWTAGPTLVKCIREKVNEYAFRYVDWFFIDMHRLAYSPPPWLYTCSRPILVIVRPGGYIYGTSIPLTWWYNPVDTNTTFRKYFNVSAIGYIAGPYVRILVLQMTNSFYRYSYMYKKLSIGVAYGNLTRIYYPYPVKTTTLSRISNMVAWHYVRICLSSDMLLVALPGSTLGIHGNYITLNRTSIIVEHGGYLYILSLFGSTVYREKTSCIDVYRGPVFVLTKKDIEDLIGADGNCLTLVMYPYARYYTAHIWPTTVIELTDRNGIPLMSPVNVTVVTPTRIINVSGTSHISFTAPAYRDTITVFTALGMLLGNMTIHINDTPIQITKIKTNAFQVLDYRKKYRVFIAPSNVNYSLSSSLDWGRTTVRLQGGGVSCIAVYYDGKKPRSVNITSNVQVYYAWRGNYLLICTVLHGSATVNITDQYYLTIKLVDMLGHTLSENRTLVNVGLYNISVPLNYSGYIFAFWNSGSRRPNITVPVLNDTILVAYYRVPTVITADAVYVPHNKTHIILKITGTLTDIYGDKIPNATLLVTLKINNTVINKKTVRTNKDGSFSISWTINSDLAKWARVVIVYPGSEIYVGSTIQVKPTPSLSLYLRQLLLLALIVAVLVAIGLALKYLTKGKNKAKR